jgi:hypothetical protein
MMHGQKTLSLLTLIIFRRYGKILAQCGKQSGFKDPRILYYSAAWSWASSFGLGAV